MPAWRGNIKNPVPNQVQHDVNRSEGRVDNNRALHVSRNTDTMKNFTVSIKDIDETVLTHLQKMELKVVDAGNNINVPVSYASPEKWKSVRNDGFMRDNNGRIILPAIIFYRESSEQDKTMVMFNKYLRYPVIKMYSEKNQYTKYSILMGKNVPVNEIYSVVMPDHMNFNYKFIIWTEYVEQMNSLIERINFETNDYWGTADGFKFRTFVDSYMHTTEVSAEADRLIRTEFNLVLRGYLLPEQFAPGLDNFKSTTEKLFTKKKIIIGMEVTEKDWKPIADNNTRDKWRSQKLPNITKEDEQLISNIPVSSLDGMNLYNFKSGTDNANKRDPLTVKWRFPSPINSNDAGEEGMVSKDDKYYYIYKNGTWSRTPLDSFNGF